MPGSLQPVGTDAALGAYFASTLGLEDAAGDCGQLRNTPGRTGPGHRGHGPLVRTAVPSSCVLPPFGLSLNPPCP